MTRTFWQACTALGATFLLATSSTAQAQSAVRLGVQGGINIADLGGADAAGTDPATGWNLGGLLQLGQGDLALMPGLILTRKGATFAAQTFSSKLAVTYLQVPLLARWRLNKAGTTGSIGTVAFAGPAVGYKLGCTVTETSGVNTASASCDETGGPGEDQAQFRSLEWSGILGFGAETGALSVALQYELGFGSIADQSELTTRTFSLVGRFFWGGARPDRTLMPRAP